MNFFIEELKQRIHKTEGNIFFHKIENLSQYFDKEHEPLTTELKKLLTSKYFIFKWTDIIHYESISLYNVHDDYIELAVKLVYVNREWRITDHE